MKRHLLVILLASLSFTCNKKEEEEKTLAAEDDPDAPDYQTKRITTPDDQTAPTPLDFFSVGTGPKLGEAEILLKFPEIHDYKTIEFRRLVGETPPEDCESGELAKTVETFEETSVIDSGLFPGSLYSYIACISDEAGNVTRQEAANFARASDYQRIFATSTAYAANLSADFNSESFATGLDGADARCQWHADEASLGGTWKALLSSETISARTRVPFYGDLRNMAGEKLSSSPGDSWDAELLGSVIYDENGEAETGFVWSGSYSDGYLYTNYTCDSWTDATSASDGILGDVEAGPNSSESEDWISAGYSDCTTTGRLYCVETDTASFTAPTVAAATTATTGSIATSVGFGSTENVSYIKLVRQAGQVFANEDCALGSTYLDHGRAEVIKTYNGSDEYPYENDSLTDAIDWDNASGFANEHGYYHYYACVFDLWGNTRVIGQSSAIQSGANYLRAFVSDTAFNGGALSIAAANTDCSTSAASAGLVGTFKALLSDSTTDAADNIGTTNSKYIYDLQGNYVGRVNAPTYFLFGFAPKTTADGTEVAAGTFLWTGTYSYGDDSGATCADWTDNTSGDTGTVGQITERFGRSYGFPYGTWKTCNNSYKIWCVEDNN
jgi:hypothetical protein